MKWIILVLLALILQLFLPWWSIAIAGLIYGFFLSPKPSIAFLHGFLGIFLLWGIFSLYVYFVNEGILARRLAMLLFLPHEVLSVLATAVLGGITGGLSAVTGHFLRNILVDKARI